MCECSKPNNLGQAPLAQALYPHHQKIPNCLHTARVNQPEIRYLDEDKQI